MSENNPYHDYYNYHYPSEYGGPAAGYPGTWGQNMDHYGYGVYTNEHGRGTQRGWSYHEGRGNSFNHQRFPNMAMHQANEGQPFFASNYSFLSRPQLQGGRGMENNWRTNRGSNELGPRGWRGNWNGNRGQGVHAQNLYIQQQQLRQQQWQQQFQQQQFQQQQFQQQQFQQQQFQQQHRQQHQPQQQHYQQQQHQQRRQQHQPQQQHYQQQQHQQHRQQQLQQQLQQHQNRREQQQKQQQQQPQQQKQQQQPQQQKQQQKKQLQQQKQLPHQQLQQQQQQKQEPHRQQQNQLQHHQLQQQQKREQQQECQQNVSVQYLDFPFLAKPVVVELMKDFKVMFVLRGLPGSGKSTLANAMLQKYQHFAVICSADYYHNKQGEYVWNKDFLQEAHTKCQQRAEKFCGLNKPVVIVDNTNVVFSDMRPYFEIAKNNDYVTVVVEPKTPWKRQLRELLKRNIHNVPFTKLTQKAEQFEDIMAIYFAWFLAPKSCEQLRKCAKDILRNCLEIEECKQNMADFSGQSASSYTVERAMSLYSLTDGHQDLHVTACFSPRGKYLGGSPYSKSKLVLDHLGEISIVTIIGWVLTCNTFSARAVLTEEQQKLWKNEDEKPQQMPDRRNWRTREPPKRLFHGSLREMSPRSLSDTAVEHTTSLLENMKMKTESPSREKLDSSIKDSKECDTTRPKPDHGPSGTSHITLGTTKDATPVQAKHDIRSIINHEVHQHAYNEYLLNNGSGIVRKYTDKTWVVYLNNPIKLPAIFSGYYSS